MGWVKMMNRGDIYWVELPGSEGEQKSCVVVSASPINQARHSVIVVPLSSSVAARAPIAVSVDCLGKPFTAVCDQVRTLNKSLLTKLAGQLSLDDMNAVDDGLRQVLSL